MSNDAGSDPLIPAYFSHSYRIEDRELNLVVHDLCWSAGLALTVDPQNGPVFKTRLEMMMQRSACFIAVVTRRDNQPRFHCSPFVVCEYGLAVQARKLRVVLMEKGVPGSSFPEPECRVVFDRHRLHASIDEIKARLARLASEAAPYANVGNRVLGEVGILIPESPQHEEAILAIKKVLIEAGYTPVDLRLAGVDGVTAARLVDNLDFVVLGIDRSEPQLRMISFIQGRSVPSIKLLHRPHGRSNRAIPRLFRDDALEAADNTCEIAIEWSDSEQLEHRLRERVEQLSVPRSAFTSKEDGTSYFTSFGATRGPVFVSNAGVVNELARRLVDRLRSYRIQPFHYLYGNSIRLSQPWKEALPVKIEESRVFLPLIDKTYWDSELCRDEFNIALKLHQDGKITFIPCYLESTGGPEVDIQGITLTHLDDDARVECILSNLDRELLPPSA